MKALDWIAFLIIFIGAINWGLVAFDYNLVVALFSWGGDMVIKVIYAIVGIAGIVALITKFAAKE